MSQVTLKPVKQELEQVTETNQINQNKVKQNKSLQNDEIYLKPVRVRTQKQIEWSRQLGKKSQEFKRLKKVKNLNQKEIHEEPKISQEDEVKHDEPAEPVETLNNSFRNYCLTGSALLLLSGGSIYYFFKKDKHKFKKTNVDLNNESKKNNDSPDYKSTTKSFSTME